MDFSSDNTDYSSDDASYDSSDSGDDSSGDCDTGATDVDGDDGDDSDESGSYDGADADDSSDESDSDAEGYDNYAGGAGDSSDQGTDSDPAGGAFSDAYSIAGGVNHLMDGLEQVAEGGVMTLVDAGAGALNLATAGLSQGAASFYDLIGDEPTAKLAHKTADERLEGYKHAMKNITRDLGLADGERETVW